MKKILSLFGILSSIVLPIKIIEYLKGIKRHYYTGYISRYFRKFGKNSFIEYSCLFKGLEYITIGQNVSISENGIITAWKFKNKSNPEIVLGNNVSIGENCHITAINKIIIGNDVLMGKMITITDNSHGYCNNFEELMLHPSKREVFSKGPVIIKDRVWIGDKATILPAVTIGEGSIVGANSVVTKDIPDFCIVAGIPAKVIRKLE